MVQGRKEGTARGQKHSLVHDLNDPIIAVPVGMAPFSRRSSWPEMGRGCGTWRAMRYMYLSSGVGRRERCLRALIAWIAIGCSRGGRRPVSPSLSRCISSNDMSRFCWGSRSATYPRDSLDIVKNMWGGHLRHPIINGIIS